MIGKLRKKFIGITAAALFFMIFFVIAAINCLFFLQIDRQLNTRLELLWNERYSAPNHPHRRDDAGTQTEGAAYPTADTAPPPEKKEPRGLFPLLEDRLRIPSEGYMILLDSSGSVTQIRRDMTENYSAEELSEIAAALYKRGKDSGWYQSFKFRMDMQTTAGERSGTVICLVNASANLYALFTLLLISSGIGAFSFLAVLLAIVLASGRAVKPVAESYYRQKQFVTDAGHELKTPLTVISASNELARMTCGDSEWFDSIDRQVEKLNRLVESLIKLAKADEEQKPVFAVFSLSDAVYDTAKSFEGPARAGNKPLTFDIAENISYYGDESRLRRVVSILMDNAVKYCDEGGSISVRLTADRQIRLQIFNDFSDTEHCEPEKMFRRFYRADPARTSDGSYGLGLSIAKADVEVHRGSIRAGVPEKGRMLLEVTLPLSSARRPTAPPKKPR